MKKIINKIYFLFIFLSCTNNYKADNSTLKVEPFYKSNRDQSRTIGNLFDNKKYGYWITVDSSGTVVLEVFYQNDTAQGSWNSYFENGELMETGFFNKGILDSVYINYYKGNQIADSGQYKMGIKTGIWRYYDEYSRELSYVIQYNVKDTVVLFDKGIIPPLPDGTPSWKIK